VLDATLAEKQEKLALSPTWNIQVNRLIFRNQRAPATYNQVQAQMPIGPNTLTRSRARLVGPAVAREAHVSREATKSKFVSELRMLLSMDGAPSSSSPAKKSSAMELDVWGDSTAGQRNPAFGLAGLHRATEKHRALTQRRTERKLIERNAFAARLRDARTGRFSEAQRADSQLRNVVHAFVVSHCCDGTCNFAVLAVHVLDQFRER